MPPKVEQMAEMANQRSFFTFILNVDKLNKKATINFIESKHGLTASLGHFIDKD